MMKSTVRAHFFTGEHGIIALTRKLHFFDGFGTKFQSEGCGNLQRSLHSFIDEDDFSELGAPMNPSAGRKLKLLTEKPEYHWESKPKKKGYPASSFPKEFHNIVKNISVELGTSSPVKRSGSGLKKISNASTSMTSDRHASHDIKVEAVEETITIKISNISSNTADSTIHSMCSSYGHFGGFARKNDGVVEALFTIKNPSDAQSLITKLNCTKVDGCKWSASTDTEDAASMVMTHPNKFESKYLEQISENCDKAKQQIFTRKVWLEDIESLHMAIYHLECQPAPSIEVPNI